MGRGAEAVTDGMVGGRRELYALHGIGMAVLQKRRIKMIRVFEMLLIIGSIAAACWFIVMAVKTTKPKKDEK